MTEQLALDLPALRPDRRPTVYWEHRGPRDWQQVGLVTRYGPGTGQPDARFPHVRTGRTAPRNIAIRRADGHTRVVPVRTLRKDRP